MVEGGREVKPPKGHTVFLVLMRTPLGTPHLASRAGSPGIDARAHARVTGTVRLIDKLTLTVLRLETKGSLKVSIYL